MARIHQVSISRGHIRRIYQGEHITQNVYRIIFSSQTQAAGRHLRFSCPDPEFK